MRIACSKVSMSRRPNSLLLKGYFPVNLREEMLYKSLQHGLFLPAKPAQEVLKLQNSL